jgi:tRNA pseudouridine13 synthase
MKVKQQPEDFQVEEITRVCAGSGPHAFYRLRKRGWSTPDALALLRRRWHIVPRRLSYGGLKDRHACTVQYLSIFHGPRRGLDQQGVQVEYLGQVPAPYTSADIEANRFRLAIRAILPDARAAVEAEAVRLGREGVPNYFDDQRFGSVEGEAHEFIGRLLVRGEFEEALRQALAAPYAFDRAAQKEEKRILLAHWGDWQRCKELLPRGHARSLVDYLRVHPGRFRDAVARLRPELRSLYLSAYQSHLWNRILARWLEQQCRPEQLRPVPLRLGALPFPHDLEPVQQEQLSRLVLPLPSARLRLAADDPLAELIQSVLAEEGLQLADMKVKGIREMFFSKGERAALCLPRSLSLAWDADELRPGRDKLTLSFELSRGSYATLLVKAIQSAAAAE